MTKKPLSIILSIIMLLSCITTIDNSKVFAASNEETIYDYLTNNLGFNSAAACGVLANIELESGFNPQKSESGGGGYGLCQWTGSRRTDLIEWCNSNGYDYRTLQGQLNFLNHELKNNYSSFYNLMKTVDNTESGAYDVAYNWCMDFERPEYKDKVHGQYNASGIPTVNGGYDYFKAYGKTYRCIAARIGLTESQYRGKIAATTYWSKYGGGDVEPPNLSINLKCATPNDEIELQWNSVTNANSYWLHIYRYGEDYINESVGQSLSIKKKFPKGVYTAYVAAIGNNGEAFSGVDFTIYDSAPSAPQPYISKDHFEINETVNITWAEVPDTEYFWLHIYRNGEDYENKSLDKALSYSAQYPEGEYTAYIVSGNGLGETISYVEFTVHSDPPDKPDLRIAKNRFTINDDVTVSWDAIANADSYWLHSYRNGEDYENKSIGTDLSYTAKYPVGEYTLYIVPINAAGETPSSVDFTVHDSKPEAPNPTISKEAFSTDEEISIKWNATADTDSYWLHIYKNGEDYVNQSIDLALNYTDKYPVGDYTAYIVSCNGVGETLSSVDFSVYLSGDCNNDGKYNISDVVLLQKWLLAVPDTHLDNWKAADMCEDDRLDVFDLCMMKRKLIYG